MKRILTTLSLVLTATAVMAMSTSKIRTHARFLTDRMAYELDLSPMQYDDCYEANFDFIYMSARIMDDVVFGYIDAIDRYYTYLDMRNEDMRYILTMRQYTKFMASQYFYSPIYSTGRNWALRVYTIYSNRSFFYFDAPTIYKTYKGGHSRQHFHNGFYSSRYTTGDRFQGNFRITGSQTFSNQRRNDFGTNLKQRNTTTYNNYRNPNSDNRTQDVRYRDNSGNTQSPQINNRTVTSGRGSGTRQTNPNTSAPTGTTRQSSSTPANGSTRGGRR